MVSTEYRPSDEQQEELITIRIGQIGCGMFAPNNGSYTTGFINGTQINFQVDSGSTISVISKNTYDRCLKDGTLPINPKKCVVQGVNGNKINEFGSVTADLTLGSFTTRTSLMVCNIVSDGILGHDFIKNYIRSWDLQTNSMITRDGRIITCFSNSDKESPSMDKECYPGVGTGHDSGEETQSNSGEDAETVEVVDADTRPDEELECGPKVDSETGPNVGIHSSLEIDTTLENDIEVVKGNGIEKPTRPEADNRCGVKEQNIGGTGYSGMEDKQDKRREQEPEWMKWEQGGIRELERKGEWGFGGNLGRMCKEETEPGGNPAPGRKIEWEPGGTIEPGRKGEQDPGGKSEWRGRRDPGRNPERREQWDPGGKPERTKECMDPGGESERTRKWDPGGKLERTKDCMDPGGEPEQTREWEPGGKQECKDELELGMD